jgi:hypothetical protein
MTNLPTPSPTDRSADVDTSEFVDKLKRALEMKEDLQRRLAELCDPLVDVLMEDDRDRVRKFLHDIQADTVRHRDILSKMLSQFSQEDE